MRQTSLATVVQLPGTVPLRRALTGVLLQCPEPVRPAASTTVYCLAGGRVGSAPLARYRLPEALRGRVVVTKGPDEPQGVECLPLLAELADRVAPWVRVHVAPRVLTHQGPGSDYGVGLDRYDVGGQAFYPCAGLACYSQNAVFLRVGCPRSMVRVLAHELAHVLWHGNFWSDDAMGAIRQAVAVRPTLPGTYPGCESEAVAALFEGWAFARFFGLPLAHEASGTLTVHDLFEEAWSGRLARWLVARDVVPGAAALRDRLGIPLHVEPAPTLLAVSRMERAARKRQRGHAGCRTRPPSWFSSVSLGCRRLRSVYW